MTDSFLFLYPCCVMASAILVICAMGMCLREVSSSNWLPLGTLLMVLIGAAGLVGFFLPTSHYLFFDEHIYLSVARTLRMTGIAKLPTAALQLDGSLELLAGDYNKEPPGFSTILALFFILLPPTESTVWIVNLLFYLLGIALTFALAKQWTGNSRVALTAAFFLATTPLFVQWSRSGSSEVYATACSCLAMLGVTHAAKRLDRRTIFLLFGGVSLCASSRPELFIIVIPALAGLDLLSRNPVRTKLFAVFLTLVAIAIPVLHISMVWHERWGAEEARFSLAYIGEHLKTNTAFFLVGERYPLMWTALALLGLYPFTPWKAVSTVWFLVVWGIFLPFYAGSYDHGVDARYALLTFPPLSILAAAGLESAFQIAQMKLTRLLLIISVMLSWAVFIPSLRSPTILARDAYDANQHTSEFVAYTEPGDAVISYVPAQWLPRDRSVLQLSHALSGTNALRHVCAKAKRVFFHWDYWCQSRHRLESPGCAAFIRQTRPKLIKEIKSQYVTSRLYLVQSLCR